MENRATYRNFRTHSRWPLYCSIPSQQPISILHCFMIHIPLHLPPFQHTLTSLIRFVQTRDDILDKSVRSKMEISWWRLMNQIQRQRGSEWGSSDFLVHYNMDLWQVNCYLSWRDKPSAVNILCSAQKYRFLSLTSYKMGIKSIECTT